MMDDAFVKFRTANPEAAHQSYAHFVAGWEAAIETAAETAIANGDRLEIHSPRIAEAIRAIK